MSVTWQSEDLPQYPKAPRFGRALAFGRGVAIAALFVLGMIVLLALRAVEWPLMRAKRPVSKYIPFLVCRAVLRILGISLQSEGMPCKSASLWVANHVSWLDIFMLNAMAPVIFVAKAEVANWPGIGWVARATGTIFISRDPKDSKVNARLIARRFDPNLPIVLFPEGTSTDGRRVLKFRSSMFSPVFADETHTRRVQPISLVYQAPKGADPRVYGWWGDMEFGEHAAKVLQFHPQGRVELQCHPILPVQEHKDRKDLAAASELVIRTALKRALRPPQDFSGL
ncbi:MAG: lysophospholipid acyltransferase family protein [Mangrovicoccus sp.]